MSQDDTCSSLTEDHPSISSRLSITNVLWPAHVCPLVSMYLTSIAGVSHLLWKYIPKLFHLFFSIIINFQSQAQGALISEQDGPFLTGSRERVEATSSLRGLGLAVANHQPTRDGHSARAAHTYWRICSRYTATGSTNARLGHSTTITSRPPQLGVTHSQKPWSLGIKWFPGVKKHWLRRFECYQITMSWNINMYRFEEV